ncbi:MAG: tRNA (adenosine(37)-N6)-threonylcarbamoyltransferase complex dimerization subunit type 1 TsaB [Candidatus Izimaplasma sp.]|nr:tRNA (adenosine(37)-N6)-threonylcarbamoyltransferase complex dimerization subunit type 1 TsaB [Candidatus Izimaplasma bacterium]
MKKSLKRLLIDSATKDLYIALYEDLECLGKYYKSGNNDHSTKLMIEIERIFKMNNAKTADLDEVIIGIGPGSYTGLRIGVVVAKMFGWNNDIQVRTISSLAMMASSSNSDKLIVAEIDARRGNSFIGVFKNEGKALSLAKEEVLTNLAAFTDSLGEPYVLVSNGETNVEKILNSKLLTNVVDIHSLNPNYLRITEAERNLK